MTVEWIENIKTRAIKTLSHTDNETELEEQDSVCPDTLNTFIWNAVIERATDVHLHCVEDGVRVLYRVDGIVHPRIVLSIQEGRKLLNQLKGAAGLDAVRSFCPKEGQITWSHQDAKCDIRVTVTPVQERESAHLRLLSMDTERWDISQLGLSDRDRQRISDTLYGHCGLVLITGGTGSGKTTSMYSLAETMELDASTTYSIEDPVEFKLPFAQQIEVDERHGLTMHEGLRTILRMDPDLIMVGEIRDRDSAVVAARAALSGKLVLATIHAQSAAGAVDSLHYLEVPHHVIGSSLRMVMAQTLVRRLCPTCSKQRELSPEEKELFEQFDITPPEQIRVAQGCPACNSYGYRGRIGLFEVAPLDESLRSVISQGAHHHDIALQMEQQGIRSLIHDGLGKVSDEITSLDELCRVFGSQILMPTATGSI